MHKELAKKKDRRQAFLPEWQFLPLPLSLFSQESFNDFLNNISYVLNEDVIEAMLSMW